MLVNVTHKDTGVNMSCSCVMFENHDVTNLVSADPQTRLRGFRVERYVRGPMTVKINFEELAKKTRYTLEAVIIRGALRDNSSMVVDVFAEDYSWEKFLGRCDLGGSVSAISNSISVLVRNYDSCLYQLSSEVKASYISEALKKRLKPKPHVAHMHNSRFLLQTQIKFLSFKIIRVKGGISAGFKWLEIWMNCDRSPYLEMPRKLPCICYSADKLIDTEIQNHILTVNTDSEQRILPEDIPSQFLDSITFELMTEPIALPSGKYVDIQTVNKLYKCEEEESKVIIDPFSGLALGNDYKPVVDVLLRDRIRDFVSNPSSNTTCTPLLTSSNTSSHMTTINSNSTTETSTDTESAVDLTDIELDTYYIRQKRRNYFEFTHETENKRQKETPFYRKPKELFTSGILPFQSDTKSPIECIDLTNSQTEIKATQTTPLHTDIIEID